MKIMEINNKKEKLEIIMTLKKNEKEGKNNEKMMINNAKIMINNEK
jgi:hypothetical protein